MDKIIEELFYGDISPLTDSRRHHESDEELSSDIDEHYRHLQDQLNNQQKEILEKYENCCSKRMMNEESDIFVYGFRLGAQIMLSVMSDS